tara:strand:+ start:2447 stop:2815 length:369 start_codon:yes stop_codon:yes gene_type:complete
MKVSMMLLALLVSSSLVSAWYYKYSQDIIMTLQTNNAKLEVAITTQKETITSMKENFERQAAALTGLSLANQSLNDEKDALSTKLMKHDLEELSRRKPVLIERRINSGTKTLFDDFIELSTQ